MPWKETCPVLERARFIEDYLSGFYTITELAYRYNVSRRTLYKWLARHDAEGLGGLGDRPRTPDNSPQETAEEIAVRVVAFRKRFPFMGPRKIIARLTELQPDVEWPAPSTAGDILRRADLVTPRRRRNPPAHPLRTRVVPAQPNDLMTCDYKGQFLLRNHRYCYPLTIVDHVSRYILACDAFSSTQQEHIRHVFEVFFAGTDFPEQSSPTTAVLSDLQAWRGFRAFPFGGSVSVSPSSALSLDIPNRTVLTNECTAPSKLRPHALPSPRWNDNSAASISSSTSTTTNGPMRLTGRRDRPRSTRHRHGLTPSHSPPSNTQGTSKPERSITPA
jgi:transposase-like protein